MYIFTHAGINLSNKNMYNFDILGRYISYSMASDTAPMSIKNIIYILKCDDELNPSSTDPPIDL